MGPRRRVTRDSITIAAKAAAHAAEYRCISCGNLVRNSCRKCSSPCCEKCACTHCAIRSENTRSGIGLLYTGLIIMFLLLLTVYLYESDSLWGEIPVVEDSLDQQPTRPPPEPSIMPLKVKRALQSAMLGDINAMHLVGELYCHGSGLPKDQTQALKFWSLAAAKGHARSMMELAVATEMGKGVLVDFQQARMWYEKAADLGVPQAAHNLGRMKIRGIGGSIDIIDGKMWLKRAATAGYSPAMIDLAMAHVRGGHGSHPSQVLAVEWMVRAAMAGEHEATQWVMTQLFDAGVRVEGWTKDTDAVVSPAQVSSWTMEAAVAGNVAAMALLGQQKEILGAHEHAASWYYKAAEQGHAISLYKAALAVENGMLEGDRVQFLKLAAEKGVLEAVFSYAKCLKYGDGVPRNTRMANEWREKGEKLVRERTL